jgi:hypothetical protein
MTGLLFGESNVTVAIGVPRNDRKSPHTGFDFERLDLTMDEDARKPSQRYVTKTPEHPIQYMSH